MELTQRPGNGAQENEMSYGYQHPLGGDDYTAEDALWASRRAEAVARREADDAARVAARQAADAAFEAQTGGWCPRLAETYFGSHWLPEDHPEPASEMKLGFMAQDWAEWFDLAEAAHALADDPESWRFLQVLRQGEKAQVYSKPWLRACEGIQARAAELEATKAAAKKAAKDRAAFAAADDRFAALAALKGA